VDDKGKQSKPWFFPWAIASYHGKEVNIPQKIKHATTDKVIGSVQNLEYSDCRCF
jgi:hypothetical protein